MVVVCCRFWSKCPSVYWDLLWAEMPASCFEVLGAGSLVIWRGPVMWQFPVPISGFSGRKKKPFETSSVGLVTALHAL